MTAIEIACALACPTIADIHPIEIAGMAASLLLTWGLMKWGHFGEDTGFDR